MNITKDCRECYSYKPQGHINTCCIKDTPCNTTSNTLSNISTLQNVTNNATRTTERSLLLATQNQLYQDNYNTSVNSTLQYATNNSSLITNMIYGQLLEVRKNRYQPYKPYIPPVIPPSVTELEMRTVNVGVPFSVSVMARCKGSQSITTTNIINY